MADNFNINQATVGTLTAMAGDDVGGVVYPRVKVGHGGDGSYADASNTSPLPVQLAAVASGGVLTARSANVIQTGANLVNTAANLLGVVAYNKHATDARYLKLYDKLSAPTVGTDVPKLTIMLKAGETRHLPLGVGIAFSLGVGVGATTGAADSDTGAPTANDVGITLQYK